MDLPPLRSRREDIPLLADHFLRTLSLENGRPAPDLHPEALEALIAYPWPGNVRELENVLERAVVLGGGSPISLDLMPTEVRGGGPHGVPVRDILNGEFSYADTVARFERELIEETLRRAQGVQRRAARILGIKPTTLNEKIRRLGVKVRQ